MLMVINANVLFKDSKWGSQQYSRTRRPANQQAKENDKKAERGQLMIQKRCRPRTVQQFQNNHAVCKAGWIAAAVPCMPKYQCRSLFRFSFSENCSLLISDEISCIKSGITRVDGPLPKVSHVSRTSHTDN